MAVCGCPLIHPYEEFIRATHSYSFIDTPPQLW